MTAGRPPWLNRTTLGISLASLLSDVSHELATAVLPAFLVSLGAGPAALGWIEGSADGLSALAKLWGGVAADRVQRRKPLASIGYSGYGSRNGRDRSVHKRMASPGLSGGRVDRPR